MTFELIWHKLRAWFAWHFVSTRVTKPVVSFLFRENSPVNVINKQLNIGLVEYFLNYGNFEDVKYVLEVNEFPTTPELVLLERQAGWIAITTEIETLTKPKENNYE